MSRNIQKVQLGFSLFVGQAELLGCL